MKNNGSLDSNTCSLPVASLDLLKECFDFQGSFKYLTRESRGLKGLMEMP